MPEALIPSVLAMWPAYALIAAAGVTHLIERTLR